MKKLFILFFLVLPSVSFAAVSADDLTDHRQTINIVRNADGTIHRSQSVLAAFKKAHPCPVTGLTTGACNGWAIDHVIPLAVCGRDALDNLQWLPDAIKSCAGTQCKDRWERKIYSCPK